MRLKDLVQHFSKKWACDPLKPDEKGQYTLVIEERFEVLLLPHRPKQLLLQTSLAVEDNRLKDLLQKHFARLRQYKEKLYLEQNALVIVTELDLQDLTFSLFDQEFQQFVNAVNFWTQQLENSAPVSSLPSSAHMLMP